MPSKRQRGIRSNVKPYILKRNLSGMDQSRSDFILRPDQAVSIENMHAVKEGEWSADRAGYSIVNDGDAAYESGSDIDGVYWFVDSSGDDHLFIACNTKLLEVDTTTGTASTIDGSASYTAGGQVDFQTIGNVLFTCDGSIATPRKWDGSTAADASGWPIDDGTNTYSKPKFLETHQGRLVALNFQGGTGGASKWESHIGISDQGDAESFTLPATAADEAYVAEVGPGDGQTITGARSIPIPASNNDALVIYKERSTYMMTGSSGLLSDADVFRIVRINGNYGAFNNNCIVEVGNDLLALNRDGVNSFSTSNDSGTIQPLNINSDSVRDVIASISDGYEDQCWGVHLPFRREVWWAVPTNGSVQNDKVIVYKYPTPGDPQSLPKWSIRTAAGVFFPKAAEIFKRDFYAGLYSGILGLMFDASTYGGTAIPYRYEYPYVDFGNEKQMKRVVGADAHFKIRGDLSATLSTRWKGGGNNDSFSNALTLSTELGGAVYGTAEYGTDYYGEQEEMKVVFKVPGNGQRVKFTLEGNTGDTGPIFLGLTPVVEFGNISQQFN